MIDVSKYQPLIGQPLAVVEQAIKADGKYIRIVKQDGKFLVVTRDYNLSRLNVVVDNGIVTSIQGLG